MRLLQLANYPRDAQESMLRFAEMLRNGFASRGVAIVRTAPAVLGGRLSRQTVQGMGKWLGYLDKYLLFPFQLLLAVWRHRPDLVHITDHSNALYVPVLRRLHRRLPVLVTCHDLLAVRYALENLDPEYRIGAAGRAQQQAIVRGLRQATHVACDSGATLGDVKRLVVANGTPVASVIPVGLAFPYRPLSRAEADARLGALRSALDAHPAFLLHVGSGQPRKNRPFLLRLLAHLSASWSGAIVFAGAPLTPEQRALAAELGVAGRVIEVVGPDNEVLNALYARAAAFLFPSRAEGFGWPIIEAQASGCPVLASNVEPHPEVAGARGAALLPLDDLAAWSEALREILPPGSARRADLVEAGAENALRHQPEGMIADYEGLCARLIA